jgi:hypothetical protein
VHLVFERKERIGIRPAPRAAETTGYYTTYYFSELSAWN